MTSAAATRPPVRRVLLGWSIVFGVASLVGYWIALWRGQFISAIVNAICALFNAFNISVALGQIPKPRLSFRRRTLAQAVVQPLEAEDPLVTNPHAACMVCHGRFEAGELVTLVPFDPLGTNHRRMAALFAHTHCVFEVVAAHDAQLAAGTPHE